MNIEINITTEQINNTTGIILAGKIIEKAGLDFDDWRKNNITDSQIIRSMFGLIVQGRFSFEEIALFRKDSLFQDALHLGQTPASPTLRLYLERIADDYPIWLTRMHTVNNNILKRADLTPIKIDDRKYIPVDCDVSPFDNSGSNKEGVSWTYKKHDGYAPIFSYIGLDGYMLDCELREGSHHCQKNTPAFLERNLELIRQLNLKHPVLFRLDSGNDSADTIKVLAESGHYFLIKKNIRRESKEYWLDSAKSLGEVTRPREGKNVYTGVLTGRYPGGNESLPAMDIVFCVTERTIDSEGNLLLFPEIDVENYWTNMVESPEMIIDLYHAHGTSEQFHSELKSDMNVEQFPSGKMKVNHLILQIAMLAFNTLRLIGQLSLSKKELLPYKTKVSRKRLRKVISDLIFIGCKIVTHARKKILRLWEHDPWFPIFKEIYQIICDY
jgi:hypothetical protein